VVAGQRSIPARLPRVHDELMNGARNGRPDFVATGVAAVVTAMSYLLLLFVVAAGGG
jgi:hypothetical protein